MAFTSEGMFYLGKEDLAPTMGMVGTGVRGMLGMQNEEEAVKSLIASSDLESLEGRQGFLNQLQGISPDAHKEFSKQFGDSDLLTARAESLKQTTELRKQEAEDERTARKNKPLLSKMFENVEKPTQLQNYLKRLYPGVNVADISTEQEAGTFLSKQMKGQSAGEVSRANTRLTKFIKHQKDMYVNNPSKLYDAKFSENIPSFTETAESLFGVKNQPSLGTPDAPVTTGHVVTPDNSQFIPIGTQDTPGITQVDPEASVIDKVLNPPIAQAAEDLKGILSNTFSTIDVQGSDKSEYDMTKTERTKENKLDALRDFLGNGSILTSPSHQYFSKNPKELVKFNKNPMMWFMKNISPKGYDYSEYNLLGN